MEATTSLDGALRPSSRGHNLLVGADVEIDPSAAIGANVVLYDGVRIGPNALIKNNCVIGELPSLAIDSRSQPAEAALTTISQGVAICNGVVIFAGVTLGERTIVGDQAYVRENVTTAEDVVIGRACNIAAGASIGARTKIQGDTYVMPRTIIEEDVFMGAQVGGATDHSMGRVEALARQAMILRSGCRIGSCACLLPGIEIGEQAFVGAGAVVRESVAPFSKVAGVPARVIGVVDDA